MRRAQEKLESSEAQVRELSERLALLEREKVELEMRASALAGGGAVPAGLLVRWQPGFLPKCAFFGCWSTCVCAYLVAQTQSLHSDSRAAVRPSALCLGWEHQQRVLIQ